MNGLLMDTHAWLWYAEGVANRLGTDALARIEQTRREGQLCVSAVSVWEVGLLIAKGRIRLSAPAWEWVQQAIALPGLRLKKLDAETALESTRLPGEVHGDPADRFLIAAARVGGLTLLTADSRILDYAAAGHVRALAP
jgi:PIN domain nuclease of toxin-antitoxin system